jgi:hypothetical protein
MTLISSSVRVASSAAAASVRVGSSAAAASVS